MTRWLREVGLVMRSDARAMWPFFALHLAVLTYGVLQAKGTLASSQSTDAGTLLMYGSAMLFSALLIHRHTPASPVAYWTSLPHDRSAVWAAKWCMLALLLACGVTAILISVHNMPDPLNRLGQFVRGKSASLFGVVAAAALVASIRRDLRTVLLLLLVLPLAGVAVLFLPMLLGLPSSIFRKLDSPSGLYQGALVVIAASFWFYRTRSISRTAVTNVMLGCATLFAYAILAPQQFSALIFHEYPSTIQLRESEVAKQLERVTLFAERDTTSNASDYSSLRLSMKGAPTDLRAEWLFASEKEDAEALLNSTRRVVVTSTGPRLASFRSELFTPELSIAPVSRWLGDSHNRTGGASAQELTPPDEWFVQAGILSGMDQTDQAIDGVVRFSRPMVITRLQLQAGGRTNVLDQQFRILERGGTALLCKHEPLAARCGMSLPSESLLHLQLISTLMESDPSLSFALVNASRGKGIHMSADWTHTRRRSPGLMLLPSNLQIIDWLLVPSYPGAVSGQLDDDWLRNAELVIVRWEPVGALPVPIRTAVTTSSAPVARSR